MPPTVYGGPMSRAARDIQHAIAIEGGSAPPVPALRSIAESLYLAYTAQARHGEGRLLRPWDGLGLHHRARWEAAAAIALAALAPTSVALVPPQWTRQLPVVFLRSASADTVTDSGTWNTVHWFAEATASGEVSLHSGPQRIAHFYVREWPEDSTLADEAQKLVAALLWSHCRAVAAAAVAALTSPPADCAGDAAE